MKYLFTIIMLSLIAINSCFTARGQNLVLRTKDGSESLRQLSALQTLTFSGNDLRISFLNGSAESYNIL